MTDFESWEQEFDFEAESKVADEKYEETGFQPVTPGEHISRIKSFERYTARTGTHCYQIRFECLEEIEGGFTVREFQHSFWLSPKALPYGITPLCRAISYHPNPKEGKTFNPDDLVGRSLKLMVKHPEPDEDETAGFDEAETDNPPTIWPEIDVFAWGPHRGMKPLTEDESENIDIWFATILADSPNIIEPPLDESIGDIPF